MRNMPIISDIPDTLPYVWVYTCNLYPILTFFFKWKAFSDVRISEWDPEFSSLQGKVNLHKNRMINSNLTKKKW